MKNKIGHSERGKTREHQLGVYLSTSENSIIRERAAKAGLPLSAYIREMLMNGQVRARCTVEERQDIRQLIVLSGNFDQMAKTAMKEGMLLALLYFERYRNQLDKILNRLQHDQ